MAKRRRLSPLPQEMRETTPVPADSPRRGAPIADMAGSAALASAAEEMAETLSRAEAEGRMIADLPLEAVAEDYLVRDRMGVEPEGMEALKASLVARGQQVPIEVAALGENRYGLISGWRRLTALRALHAETGEARFSRVRALLRRPEAAAEAYLAMVEENEIRVGLSYYERARIVVRAVEEGVFADDREGLQSLFAAASRPRRSKIGSFMTIVRALDGHLRFARDLGERAGLALSKALEADPDLGARLGAALDTDPPRSAEAELAFLTASREGPATPKPPEPVSRRSEPVPGVSVVSRGEGRLVLEGRGVDDDLRRRLEEWLRS